MTGWRDRAYLDEWRKKAAEDARARDVDAPEELDEVDRKVRAHIEYRDRMAEAVSGPVPEFGSAEWRAADWRTQVASFARHLRAIDVARGKQTSSRLLEESQRRRDMVEASHAVAEEAKRRGWSRDWGVQYRRWGPTGDPRDWVKPRPGDYPGRRGIPVQRAGESVARVREARLAVERQEEPVAAREQPAAERVR